MSDTKPTYKLKTFIRGTSAEKLGIDAHITYCYLGKKQPLILIREPDNPKDASAVLVSDLMGQACGYIAREHAGEVSAKLAAGEVLLARTNGPCMCVYRKVFIWSEGEVVEKEERRRKRLGNPVYAKPKRLVKVGEIVTADDMDFSL